MYDLFDIRKKPKDRTALIADTGENVTYGGLAAQMVAFRQAVARRTDGDNPGTGAGCAFLEKQESRMRGLVFCMCRNEPGAVTGYLGAMASDCVPLLLAANLKDAQFASFFETYRPAYIWAPEDWGKGHGRNLWDAGEEPLYQAYGYELRVTGNAPYAVFSDLALLLATSGSTGDPKLVRLSRRNLIANAKSIGEYLELDETERPVTTLPMQYTYGLSIINSHLLAGAAILMTTAGYVQSGFWDFFERERATSFGGVPYTYEILKKIHFFREKPASLRSITQAGGKLPVPLQQEVARWARSQGVRFYVMYGQTEATARMSYLPPEKCLEKPGSIGIAIPGGRFRLADDGELVYEGENVSLGYAAGAGDLQLGDERRGVLYSGDLARRDADGYYYIIGRKKRFVKIFGVRVSLDACEQTLRGWYPGVEIACAGSDDCLNIYMADKREALDGCAENQLPFRAEAGNSVADRFAEHLHLNRRAFHVMILERIPKNDAGKILYQELT